MAGESKPKPSEELYLVWLFFQNFRVVRRSRNRFNKMFSMQKSVRQLLGMPFRAESDEQMMQYVEKQIEELQERFAFRVEGWHDPVIPSPVDNKCTEHDFQPRWEEDSRPSCAVCGVAEKDWEGLS